jgi:tetratricopeptide (TPR) repeat protein
MKVILADALGTVGNQSGNNEYLKRAIDEYQRAFTQINEGTSPVAWAMIENNLGIALADLGERESGTAHLQQAVAAFQQVLLKRTRTRAPLAWAMTENNLGIALRELGERDKDSVRLCAALQAHTSAWQAFETAAPYNASMALEGTQQDLRVIFHQTSPATSASCLANQALVLKQMGLKGHCS